jgi:cyclophilin family peptidyl-prolyl cis-trans isomerase/protein-disulfide isomerase
MRKLLLPIFLSAAVLLAACSQATLTPSSAGQVAPLATQDIQAVEMECQVTSLVPTQSPELASAFPPPGDDDWKLGSDDPVMTILEYSDFQCPYCAQVAPVLSELVEKHPDDVQVIFRHFPLPSHVLAVPAAVATEAAGLQGEFWEMHDRIFAAQSEWTSMPAEEFAEWLKGQAVEMGLDEAKFAEDFEGSTLNEKVKADQQKGIEVQIPGTPFMVLNGQIYQGPRDLGNLEAILQLFNLKDQQFTYCPPMQIDVAKQYIATLETEKGDVVIQLFPDKAPMTVNSFVFLARQGWLNNVTFHRVLPDFVAQSGDPSGTGFGGPGYTFADEITELNFDKAGVVGMANSGPGSNGSQFFITYGPVPNLDGKYTVFGEVIEGMDNLQSITPRDPSESLGLPPGDKILSIKIQEK